MKINLFDFDDYKRYLDAYSRALPKRGYGFKSRLAEAAGCRTAYIAQVLHSHADLSLEQAEAINPLLKHNEAEGEFFLLLVQHARASSKALRARFEKRKEELRARQLNLKERFQATTQLSEADLYEFLSRWYLNAVQLGATIPRLKRREALQKALGLSDELLSEALDFLTGKGLLQERGGKLEPGTTRVFIGKDSPSLKMHHANWRAKAVQALDHAGPKDIHFTSVYSLSAKDASQIRERLIREIEAVRAIVKESPEEELHTFTMDFFRVDREN